MGAALLTKPEKIKEVCACVRVMSHDSCDIFFGKIERSLMLRVMIFSV